jgi:hypothetical protein
LCHLFYDLPPCFTYSLDPDSQKSLDHAFPKFGFLVIIQGLGWKFRVIKIKLFCTSLFMCNVLVMLELTPLVAMPALQCVRTSVWQLFDFVVASSFRILKTFKIKEQPVWVLRKSKIE